MKAQSLFAGSNIYHVKQHNLRAILLTFLHTGTISRAQLAKRTRLSNTAITNLTAELLEQGILVETGHTNASPNPQWRRVGRPQRMLQLVPNARYVVGVHIGIGMYRVAVTNLQAEIVHNKIAQFDITQQASKVLADVGCLVDDTITESGVDRQLILGVGVGASGLVNHATGVNVHAASLGWHNVPVRSLLEKQLELPVCVENNVRSMTLGEAYFGLGRGVDVLAFIYGRIGVGAGFVINGRLFRGFGAGAGEIGHTIVLPHDGAACRCGQHGCLETLVSEPILLQEAQELANRDPNGQLATFLNQQTTTSIDAVFAAARAGDISARQLLEARAYYLGVALANLVNILNPELIILGGMFAQGEDLIIPIAEQTMKQTAFAGLGERVRLLPTDFGWRAGVIGAASLALLDLFFAVEQNPTD